MVATEEPIQILVWDEQQPEQKQVYEDFLGNEIANYLQAKENLVVRSVKLDDPEQGLSDSHLNHCEVLIWWGHRRQLAVTEETGKKIVERIKAGNLSLIALHSAHWSTPFVEAMQERTRLEARQRFANEESPVELEFIKPPQRFIVPKKEDALTPFFYTRKFPDGRIKVQIKLPLCIFPAYCADQRPSQIRCLQPNHPIAEGVPQTFDLPGTEMYDEPFHVPEPDEVIFEERWESGEWFRSGTIWNVGKGKVFYFRPGHETYPIFKDPHTLKILENAVRYLARSQWK